MSHLIPREFIHELLSRCDLVELIDERVPLKKKGSNYVACCPFHQEKTPSFTVNPSKQIYHCFGCHVSGNAIGFLMEYDRLTFVESVEELAKQLRMELPRQQGGANILPKKNLSSPDLYYFLEQAAFYFQQQLRNAPTAIAYLKNRGLSGKIAKEFAIGYAPDAWDSLLKRLGSTKEATQQLLAAGLIIKKSEGGYYDRFRDRIMFPIRDRRGRVIAFGGRIIEKGEPKYLNSPETAVFHKGHELYGLYETNQVQRESPRLLVVEGYMDVVALAQHDIRYAVATLGTATSSEHIQKLFRLTSEVIFCFDGDIAGQTAAWRALENILPLLQDGWQVRFLILPVGEDPDSLIRKEGREKFIERMNQATPLTDFLYVNLCNKIDISSTAGKAKLAKTAVPLLNKIPENIFKIMLFEQLAHLVRLEVNTLKKIAYTTSKDKKTVVFESKTKKAPLRRSAMRLAIALLLQNPNLAKSLTNLPEIQQLKIAGIELFLELVTIAQAGSDLNTGTLLEYWRDRVEKNLLEQLATWDIGVPESGVEQEFLGVCAKLIKQYRDQKADNLLQKAKLSTLTEAEKIELQGLIASD